MPDSSDIHFKRLTVVGVGLLGASLGMAALRRGIVDEAIGVGRDAGRLRKAVDSGAISSYTLDLAEGCREADLVVLCGPVSVILRQLPAVLQAVPPRAIVTDVGSTKHSIVELAEGVRRDGAPFIGSHPMAGSEKSGAEFAQPDLYQGATVILTPSPSTDSDALTRVETFWKAVGMRVAAVSPKEHDRLLARLSHLPHLTAAALVLQTVGDAASTDLLCQLAGPGFRDTTRIAMGSVPMWKDIFLDNKQAMIESIDAALELLQQARRTIANEDAEALSAFLDQAAQLRQLFDKKDA
ncbi:prephenate dehydrogenase/arogenate dehydrogenase family protein [bacterium]|nr:prephenate dehydrogenase/arogenate dehydrogenase family protein [bacterium]